MGNGSNILSVSWFEGEDVSFLEMKHPALSFWYSQASKANPHFLT